MMTAERLLSETLRGRRVVLLGANVSRAFGVSFRKLSEVVLSWHPVGEGLAAAVVPHPSGLNRWWNDPDNRVRARLFLRPVLLLEIDRLSRNGGGADR